MISFLELRNYGRLENKIFRYFLLREAVRRLDATVYCPKWSADDVFDLADEKEGSDKPAGIIKTSVGDLEAGFDAGIKVLGRIRIGTNVMIRANAVVTPDVPDGSVAVGIRAVVRPGTRAQPAESQPVKP